MDDWTKCTFQLLFDGSSFDVFKSLWNKQRRILKHQILWAYCQYWYIFYTSFFFFFYLGMVVCTGSRHSLVSLHQIPVIGNPYDPLFLSARRSCYITCCRLTLREQTETSDKCQAETNVYIIIYRKIHKSIYLMTETESDKTLHIIIITHLATVCELLDLSSCDARNHQANCHNSKTGQYLIPHDCGEIWVHKHREIIAEDNIYFAFQKISHNWRLHRPKCLPFWRSQKQLPICVYFTSASENLRCNTAAPRCGS